MGWVEDFTLAIFIVLVQEARVGVWMVNGAIFGIMPVTAVATERVVENYAGAMSGCSAGRGGVIILPKKVQIVGVEIRG